jgi:hypothetical protein
MLSQYSCKVSACGNMEAIPIIAMGVFLRELFIPTTSVNASGILFSKCV